MVALLIVFTIVLVYQYTILNNLKRQKYEYESTIATLTNNIDSIQSKIDEYNKIMNDESLLSDYAEHNGYYNTDEVYIVK